MREQDKNKVTDDAFDMYQPFVTNEQKFKYWEESKAEIKRLNAASQHYEREIAEFQQRLAERDLRYRSCDAYVTELSAQVNRLRDLLVEARDDCAQILSDYERLLPFKKQRYDVQKALLDNIDKALAATAPQSLQSFENEVLERAAKVCDELMAEPSYHEGAIYCAEVIRALKEVE